MTVVLLMMMRIVYWVMFLRDVILIEIWQLNNVIKTRSKTRFLYCNIKSNKRSILLCYFIVFLSVVLMVNQVVSALTAEVWHAPTWWNSMLIAPSNHHHHQPRHRQRQRHGQPEARHLRRDVLKWLLAERSVTHRRNRRRVIVDRSALRRRRALASRLHQWP